MTEAIRPVPTQGEIAGDVAAVTPLERVGRQIRELKSLPDVVARPGGGERPAAWAELTETGKLDVLDKLDWQGVTPLERLCVIDGEVDLNRVSPMAQRNYLGDLRHQVMQSIDAERRPTPAAIIADPKAYLTEQQQQPGQEHDHGRER
jgi:hypothetical protein